jgi:protein TonB
MKAKRRVKPKYPASAKQLNLEGSCQIRFYIDEKGKPYEIKIEKCPKVFHDAAKQAAWGWRFYPMRVEGKAVKAEFVLALKFKLN